MIADENNVCTFARNVCSRTHRDSDGSLHESRSVIDPVTYHNDVTSSLGELADKFQLVLGQKFSGDFVDAQLSTDVLGHGLGISREKNSLQSHRFELLDCLCCFRSKHIRNDERTEEPAVSGYKNL